jgi:hypothetical protein
MQQLLLAMLLFSQGVEEALLLQGVEESLLPQEVEEALQLTPMLWICTVLYQDHGRRLSLAWRALALQLHLLELWLCSRGVKQLTILSLSLPMLQICITVLLPHGQRLGSV